MTTTSDRNEKEISAPAPSACGANDDHVVDSTPVSAAPEGVDAGRDDTNSSNGRDGTTVGSGKTSDSGQTGDGSSAEITGTTGNSEEGIKSTVVKEAAKEGAPSTRKSCSNKCNGLGLKAASVMDRIFGQRHPIGLAPQPQPTTRRWTSLCGIFIAVAVVVGISVAIGVLVGGSNNKDGQSDGNDSGVDGDTSLAALGLCGDGVVGNGTCTDGLCCSLYGFCGYSELHCINGQVPPPDVFDENTFCGERTGFPGNGTCANSTECCWVDQGKCELSYFACNGWWFNTTRGRPCGGGEVGDGLCEVEGDCCSEWGWCGSTEDYCDSGRRQRFLRSNSKNANVTEKLYGLPSLVGNLTYQEQKKLFELRYNL
mmetsp:Transcript_55741/g.135054  ORF Transcript_55741/g.135054 Transcript_55741/m.135054 type:complete len:369 (+) Transcript_55741:250-1356(+)|eukprot:CAMPEP_0113518014 /NCGR_PEP_ID=MMETSP0014_2-20120614/42608_1 /TAXON_ID=2857 /ORGANISM="Nitzschia sp." /LENGTH=368 /DNA_ID=CAMNT_0000415333 /DNA_START=160 /DNA_END=1266 /DNA_ORIENTATION=- /assembly_acc=CAM_ASM_000159